MKTLIKSPAECSQCELNTFELMVKEGGQVSSMGLRARIEQTEKLIFIWKDENCVAIAGLKKPAQAYKVKVFEASGTTEKIDEYKFEMGYIYANIKGVGSTNARSS